MMAFKPNLVITGASGLLGHWLCMLAREHWSVHAFFLKNRPQVDNIKAINFDVTQQAEFSKFLRKLNPAAVLHAAANANVPDCEANPPKAEMINVHVPAHLAKICHELNMAFLFTSSDLVFDGLNAPYDENSPPNPVGVYGKQKRQAENKVMRYNPKALICRLPLMFGLAPHSKRNFMVQMLSAIAKNRPLNLFVDEYRTPIDNCSAAKGILQVLGRVRGILHLGGRTRLSRYDMGLLMAAAMQVKPTMIQGIQVKEAGLSFKRAPDCSMDSQKAYALGYDPAPIKAAVEQVVKQYLKENLYA
jgi:dTDP-4-dehydrorhamnose reductase